MGFSGPLDCLPDENIDIMIMKRKLNLLLLFGLIMAKEYNKDKKCGSS